MTLHPSIQKLLLQGYLHVWQLTILIFDLVLLYIIWNKKDEESQINGILMIMDLKRVGWKHVKNISPLYSKRMMSLLQVRGSLGV